MRKGNWRLGNNVTCRIGMIGTCITCHSSESFLSRQWSSASEVFEAAFQSLAQRSFLASSLVAGRWTMRRVVWLRTWCVSCSLARSASASQAEAISLIFVRIQFYHLENVFDYGLRHCCVTLNNNACFTRRQPESKMRRRLGRWPFAMREQVWVESTSLLTHTYTCDIWIVADTEKILASAREKERERAFFGTVSRERMGQVKASPGFRTFMGSLESHLLLPYKRLTDVSKLFKLWIDLDRQNCSNDKFCDVALRFEKSSVSLLQAQCLVSFAIHNFLFKFVFLCIDWCVHAHSIPQRKWKVMTAHPEKGGDPKTFQKLNKAVTVSKIWKRHKIEWTTKWKNAAAIHLYCLHHVICMSLLCHCYLIGTGCQSMLKHRYQQLPVWSSMCMLLSMLGIARVRSVSRSVGSASVVELFLPHSCCTFNSNCWPRPRCPHLSHFMTFIIFYPMLICGPLHFTLTVTKFLVSCCSVMF